MNTMLVEIFENYYHPSLDEFLEAMTDHELNFLASSLHQILQDQDEITNALNRAMCICNNFGLPIREHFKAIYMADHDLQFVKIDWKLSKLAYMLSILNGNPENPIVGQMQIKLLKKLI